MISIKEPSYAYFDFSFEDKRPLLKAHLVYIDKKVDYEIKRFKGNAHWYATDEDSQAEYQEKLDELKASRRKSVLFETDDGVMYTYSGLAHKLANDFQCKVNIKYNLPAPQIIPYASIPKHKARDYQVAAHDALLESAHLGPRRVEIGTGLGKSTIIRMLVKSLGMKTVIMAPSKSIAKQLFSDLTYHFGKKYVGFFGDGKKQSDKLIVIGIDDSLTKVEPGSEHWLALSKAAIFIADESHLCPAETLAKVCLGVCRYAPYRFFFSATQIRQDGLEIVLDGITGETVYSMTVRQGVDLGYLARPNFKVINVTSESTSTSPDPNVQTRKHLYYNPNVLKKAASLANRFVSIKRPTVILVEELEQFTKLLPYLKHDVAFAHGPLDKNRSKLIPEQYKGHDTAELVEDFNNGKIPILVGTSCIATGTDIQAAEAMIYLMGKSSEVKTKQAVGRSTRGGKESFVFNPWTNEQKLECVFVDFNVTNVDTLTRHSAIRTSFYNEIYGPVEVL